MHSYRFFDETGKTLYLLKIFDPVDDLVSRLLAKKIELTIEYHCEVFYEEVE